MKYYYILYKFQKQTKITNKSINNQVWENLSKIYFMCASISRTTSKSYTVDGTTYFYLL